jgi:hypothetical protein
VKRPHFSPALASFELAWTDAAFDTIYPEPPLGVLPHGVLSMHPARFFQSVLATVPLEQSVGLRLTLWMIALAPLFTIGKLGTIASIGPDDRVRVLERLLASRNYFVRQLTMSFKAIATLLYAQSERVRVAMTTPLNPDSTSQAPLVSATRMTSRAKAKTAASTESRGAHEHAAE